MTEFLSVTEYAERTGKDPGNVRRMLAAGRLKGRKVGSQWIIPASAAYPADRRVKDGSCRDSRLRLDLFPDRALARSMAALSRELRDIAGDKLAEIILGGAFARGDAGPDSPVELALLLRGAPTLAERAAMEERAAARGKEAGRTVAFEEIDADWFAAWADALPDFRRLREEGVTLRRGKQS